MTRRCTMARAGHPPPRWCARTARWSSWTCPRGRRWAWAGCRSRRRSWSCRGQPAGAVHRRSGGGPGPGHGRGARPAARRPAPDAGRLPEDTCRTVLDRLPARRATTWR
ncbi:hypothetical protein LT493_02400 [Streptomyces tricolor]|nr:hypothetical protein [Streptomyces tricolor]